MKIIHNKENCIGCGLCAEYCPKFWKMGDDDKAEIIGGKKRENGDYEIDIDEVGCNKDAEEACPVQVIKIIEN